MQVPQTTCFNRRVGHARCSLPATADAASVTVFNTLRTVAKVNSRACNALSFADGNSSGPTAAEGQRRAFAN